MILYIENPEDSTKKIKTVRTNKQIQYSSKVQNQYTKLGIH